MPLKRNGFFRIDQAGSRGGGGRNRRNVMDTALLLAENHGFLPTRGSLMLDFVFVAMIAVVPILAVSVYLVKFRHKYELHKQIQVVLGVVLLLTVIAFELDMRFGEGWKDFAAASPHYDRDNWSLVWYSLCVHLCFAIPTPLLWIFVIVRALRRFPSPPTPGEHSRSHIFWARLAACGICLTAVTGWVFYYLAFVAEKA